MSQSEDLQAIHSYFSRTAAKNPKATEAKTNWFTWYNTLSLWQKSMDDSVLIEAKQRRINFNSLNGDVEDVPATVTPQEKAEWLNRPIVNTTGMTPEQAVKAAWTPKSGAPSAATATMTTIKRPVLRQGSTGSDVADWQHIIGVTADGKFGPGTKAATQAWQKAHGLSADGVVGPATWTKAAALTQPEDKGIIQTIAEKVAGTVVPTQSPVTAPTGAARATAIPAKTQVKIPQGSGTGTAPAARAAAPATVPNYVGPVPSASIPGEAVKGMIAESKALNLPGWTKWLGLGAVVAALSAAVVGYRSGKRS
jgi:peptidoglycan hydrolase-like protein with peptidoglycan-binding domain